MGDNVNKDFQAPKQLGMRWRLVKNPESLYSESTILEDYQPIDIDDLFM